MATTSSTPVLPPVITAIRDDVAPTTGLVNVEGTTNDVRPQFEGTGEPGTQVSVYDNGIKLGTAEVGIDWLWSFTPSADLEQGRHTFTVVGSRLDGSDPTLGEGYPTIDIGADGTPPTPIRNPPYLWSVTDDVGPVVGTVDRGVSTNDTLPVLSGNGDPQSHVSIYDNGTLLGTTVVDADGGWSYAVAQALATGTHTFTTTGALADGTSVQPGVGEYPIVVGSDPAQAPVFTAVNDDVGPVQGLLNNWALLPTDDTQPTLHGQGEAGTVVSITIDDSATPAETVLVGADGHWSLTMSTPLEAGQHRLYASAQQADGSGVSTTGNYFVTAIDPNGTGTSGFQPADMPPVITSIQDTGATPDSILSGYGVTDDPQPVLNGTALPGTRLEVLDRGVKIGEFTTPANAWEWSYKLATALAAGDHELSVRTIPADGSAPVASPYAWSITEGTAGHPMAEPVITDVRYSVGWSGVFGRIPDEGAVGAEVDEVVRGTAVPGAWVDVYDNGQLQATVLTDSDWTWSAYIGARGTGHHEISAVARWGVDDQVGTSAPYKYAFDVGNGQESVRPPVIVSVTDDVGAAQGLIDTNSFTVTDDSMPTFAGTAQPGLKLEIFSGGALLGEPVVGDDWQWTFTPATPLTDGYHAFDLRSTTDDGLASSVTTESKGFYIESLVSQAAEPAALDTLLANAGLTEASTPVADGASGTNGTTDAAVAPLAQAAALNVALHHDLAY